VGEFDLIKHFFLRAPPRRAVLGIGDDCALIDSAAPPGSGLAISTDMLVCGRHFFADVDPRSLGHKALAVNLSDLAAMGAVPRAFTLALALPNVDLAWLTEFSAGMFALADLHDCELIGGDTTRGPLNICITVFGDCPPAAALRRDSAEPDDDIWVSGELGAASFAVAERYAARPLGQLHPARRRAEWPVPQVALGQALRHLARAAIDISDGLLGDLGHICERSRLGAELLVDAVPIDASLSGLPVLQQQSLALRGGDDYELVFTAALENRLAIAALGDRMGLRLSRIGRMTSGAGVLVLDQRGQPIHADIRSFDHFAEAASPA
jgi:thiamine-monophosphate kinase